MAIARGPGQKIDGGGMGIPAGARVYCQIQPILYDAAGVALENPGRADSQGNYLHIRYNGNLNLRSRSGGVEIPGGVKALDYTENKVSIEFDAQSMMTFPFEGDIELIGGLGQYKFGLSLYGLVDMQFYQPIHRWLQTYVPIGQIFTVPNYHTFILATSSGTVLRDAALGVDLEPSVLLPGNAVIAGTQYGTVKDTVIKTGWLG